MYFKLGRGPVKFHPRTLQLAKYLPAEVGPDLPDPSRKVYREYKFPDYNMYGNDQYGCCVWAMHGGRIILETAHTGTPYVPTLSQILEAYAAVTGFDPVTGANDNGTSMTDALEYMRTTGIGGHKILAWAQVNSAILAHRELGVDLFGSTQVGVNLPMAAQEQFANGQSWEYVASGIDGRHAILHTGYGSEGGNYRTWGKPDQKASSLWEKAYVEEEYVSISEDWFDLTTGKTPGGIDRDTLYKDITLLNR